MKRIMWAGVLPLLLCSCTSLSWGQAALINKTYETAASAHAERQLNESLTEDEQL